MSHASQDSTWDMKRFHERTRHTARESSPDSQMKANGHAETDLTALGAAFWDRRESLPRPHSLDISEGEEIARRPSQLERIQEVIIAVGVAVADPLPVGSAATPTRPPSGPDIQPSGVTQLRGHKRSRIPRRRRREHGPGSQSSVGTPKRQRQISDTSDDEEDGADERARSTTPTPYIPQSNTPSHRSLGTEDDHGEGQGPLSPNPWSSSFRYDPDQPDRNEVIAVVDGHFPVGGQPVAE